MIDDCAAKAELIHDGWLIRDYGGMSRQFDIAPRDHARAMIDAGAASPRA